MDPAKQSKASGYELFILSLNSDEAKGRAVTAAENQMIPEDLEEGFERALSDLRAEANLEVSISVAKLVNQELSTIVTGTQKKIQMGPFYVLYGAEMPALLIEAGYLSNRNDLKFFMDDSKRKLFTDRLASSIQRTLANTPKAR
jgi:N-acetylmuramoyl-L-alanine amidase